MVRCAPSYPRCADHWRLRIAVYRQRRIARRGKYSGVVIFDRWDTCLLLIGVYLTYVSDAVKEELRPYKHQAIQLDASVVSQPINPGDGLIQEYTIVGLAPQNPQGQPTQGLSITAQSDFDSDHEIAFWITLENSADSLINIDSGEIGPTLLGLRMPNLFHASDGKSEAWITRANLLTPVARSSTLTNKTVSANYNIDPKAQVTKRFSLNPGESKRIRVIFKVPPGPYQFLVGFGGGVHEGKSLASNAVFFHVDDIGRTVLDK